MAEPTTIDDFVVLDGKPAQPNLPTPAEIIAAEQQQAAIPAAPSPAPPVEPAAAAPIATEEQLAEIELKIRSGEQLSSEEIVLVSKIEAAQEPAPPAPAAAPVSTFKIGKEELSAQQVEERMRAEFGLTGKEISPESVTRMVQMYVKAQNRSEAQISVARGYEENAQQRQAVALERQKLEGIATSLLDAERRLVERQNRLAQRASIGVTESDVKDPITGQIDIVKFGQFQDKNRAIEELNEVKEELAQLSVQKSSNQREVRVAIANEFMAIHPEFQVKESITELATKISQGLQVDPEDEIKVLELTRLMDEAVARGIPLEKAYAIEERRGTLAVKPAAQPAKGQPSVPSTLPQPPITLAQKVANLRQQIAKASPSTAAPSAPMAPKKPSNAQEIIRDDQRTLGMGSADPVVRDMGY